MSVMESARYTAVPVQAYHRPIGFQDVEAPRFRDSRHMKVELVSAVLTRPKLFLVLTSVRG